MVAISKASSQSSRQHFKYRTEVHYCLLDIASFALETVSLVTRKRIWMVMANGTTKASFMEIEKSYCKICFVFFDKYYSVII